MVQGNILCPQLLVMYIGVFDHKSLSLCTLLFVMIGRPLRGRSRAMAGQYFPHQILCVQNRIDCMHVSKLTFVFTTVRYVYNHIPQC